MARNRPKSPAPEPGPKDRELAMAMLAEGWMLNDVAATLRVQRATIRRWRDCPEGQRMLAEAKAQRAVVFAEAVRGARELLSGNALHAAQVLVDKLRDPKPFEALTAAEAILGRVGLPRATKTEVDLRPSADLTKLSPSELDTYEALVRKATEVS